MRRRICIVSLRYNPAHVQHLVAYAKLVRELGNEPYFILDPGYRKFPELADLAQVFGADSNFSSFRFSHALIYNASTANRMIAATLKLNGTKILYVLHEPRQPILNFLWAEGPIGAMRGLAAHYVSIPLIRTADNVLLASQFAVEAFDASDRRYNENRAYFPLIYDDEAPRDFAPILRCKRFFGFIGGLTRTHGFDQYLRFMRRELRSGSDLHFLIASRHPLPKAILKDPVVMQNAHKVSLRCGRPLSKEEMNSAYAECFCIWNIYRRIAQSGVLPKAFMFGTPILASTVGSFPEFVQDGSNGRFAESQEDQAISEALHEIRTNLGRYATSCRKTFTERFFYRSNSKRFADLL